MKENPNQSFQFTKPQAAAEPVDLSQLLDEISAAIRAHVVLSAHAATALALWVVHTYVFDTRDAVAYVSIESPEKRCGKTTLLSVLAGLACRALVASNITVSALFRVIDDAGPTLLIDEADTFLGGNSVMRGILNCGNTWRTAYVLRLSGRKGRGPKPDAGPAKQGGLENDESLDSSLVRYSCWCPKVIAMIGRVPDTIADRSVVIRLERKLVSEKCAPLTDFKPETITAKCVRFAGDNSERIAQAALETVPGLNDRAADTFEPLFVLARMAGPEWFERAAEAAVFLTSSQNSDLQGAGLLLDILTIFVETGGQNVQSRYGGVFARGRHVDCLAVSRGKSAE
jgi:putative DNA primase/helicase